VAVQAFIDGRIRFTDIPRVVVATLAEITAGSVVDTLEGVLETASWTRSIAMTKITDTGRKRL